MGKSIYLTDNEIQALISTCTEWSEMLSEGDDTVDLSYERMKSGLGSALYKLYPVGSVGRKVYNGYSRKIGKGG